MVGNIFTHVRPPQLQRDATYVLTSTARLNQPGGVNVDTDGGALSAGGSMACPHGLVWGACVGHPLPHPLDKRSRLQAHSSTDAPAVVVAVKLALVRREQIALHSNSRFGQQR